MVIVGMVVYGIKGVQTKKAKEVANDLVWYERKNIHNLYFTGHSLGGYLAAWVESEVVDGDIEVPYSHHGYTYNAPGIMPNVKFSTDEMKDKIIRELLGRYDKRITNYSIKYDPVSAWGNNLGTVKTNKAKGWSLNPFWYHFAKRFKEIGY